MFNVYEIYTWDDVNYIKKSSHETKEEAEKECTRLNAENNLKAVCYCVMSDWEYKCLMSDEVFSLFDE